MDDQDEVENDTEGDCSGLYQLKIVSHLSLLMYGDEDNCHITNHSEEVNFAWALSRLIITARLHLIRFALILLAVLALYSSFA
jgi:hypothetical protein